MGGPIGIQQRAPSLVHDKEFAAIAFTEMNRDIDVRAVLPAIRVPTLVLHAAGDRVIEAGCGRDMAARIPGARYVELPWSDHLPWLGDADAIVQEIERFVAAAEPSPEPDRLLVTVVRAEALPAPENYLELVGREVARFRGRLLEAAGGIVLGACDGPARAIRCATAIVQAVGGVARAGLHTGECEVRSAGLGGPALDVVRRVASAARGGETVVTETVKDLVAGSGIEFLPRGAGLFAVAAAAPADATSGPLSAARRRRRAAAPARLPRSAPAGTPRRGS